MFIYTYKHYLYAIADARKDWIERCLAITIDDLPTTSKIAVDSSASARLSSPRRDAYTVLCALCLLVQTSATCAPYKRFISPLGETYSTVVKTNALTLGPIEKVCFGDLK